MRLLHKGRFKECSQFCELGIDAGFINRKTLLSMDWKQSSLESGESVVKEESEFKVVGFMQVMLNGRGTLRIVRCLVFLLDRFIFPINHINNQATSMPLSKARFKIKK